MDSVRRNDDDLEAMPPGPEKIGRDPIVVDPSPHRSVFSGRKKAVAAVFTMVLVAAVATGVTMSVKPGSPRTVLEETAAAVAIPGEDEITAHDQQAGVDSEEDFDIIDDQGFSGNYSEEDIDYDEGVRPEEEDKVPVDDVDGIEIADFDGPLTDFVFTSDVLRIDVPTNGACADPTEAVWNMELITDNYPWETSYTVKDAGGSIVMAGPPEGRNYERSKKYLGSICVPEGEYLLEVTDAGEDGMCCEFGSGGMVVKVNGKKVASTPETNFSSFKRYITVEGAGTSTGTKPTADKVITTSQLYSVDIKVKTDGYGSETGYKFEKINGNVLFNKAVGSLVKNTLYKNNVLVEAGQYRLTLTDNFSGLENGGYFSVSVDGEEVLFGDKWNTQLSKTLIYTIRPGYTPTMTDRDKEWLAAHNTRRKTYHEAQGKTYRPLLWSQELADASSDWADQILPTCSIVRETGVQEGENMSTRKSSVPRNEGPEVLLGRWSDKPLKNGLGYPANQAMTQVMWRATRYVGCSDKMVKSASGTYCYVSICRYARAGNCAMSQYSSWKVGTLADRTKCGPACPSNVCY